jgi:hypothetical protein
MDHYYRSCPGESVECHCRYFVHRPPHLFVRPVHRLILLQLGVFQRPIERQN